jgi:serine/threonine protein kinase
MYPLNEQDGSKSAIMEKGTILKSIYFINKLVTTSHVSRIYRGKNIQSQKDIIIKELLSDNLNIVEKQQIIEQFQFEAGLLLRLKHVNLPDIEDAFDVDEKKYLVMEYIKGKKLSGIVSAIEEYLDEAIIIKWALELCEVIEYLHTRKPHPIIFRGLCPENIILSEQGRLKLIDFGISKLFDPKSRTLAIAKTAKMHYSPMEQYVAQTDEKSDIYSLGATLYFLTTKTPPPDSVDRLFQATNVPPCKELNPKISAELGNIICKAMEIDARKRYNNIIEMKHALASIQVDTDKAFIPEQWLKKEEEEDLSTVKHNVILLPDESSTSESSSKKTEIRQDSYSMIKSKIIILWMKLKSLLHLREQPAVKS